MKLTIPTKQLLAALATIKTIAKPSTTHPILSNVCITATAEGITLLGMDLEKQLTIDLPATVKKQGSTTLSCVKLHDSLAKARGADCQIETNDAHETTVRVGSAVTKLRGLAPEDMPQPIDASGGIVVHIPATTLAAHLTKSLVHSAIDKSKAILQSITAVSRDGKLNFQATDNKRAIMCNPEIDFATKDQFIIPKESVPPIITLATDGEIEMMFCEGALIVKSDNAFFATKLIEGRLPDFKTMLPNDLPVKITANREELIGIVEYAEVQTTELARRVALSCDGSKITAKGAGGVIDSDKDTFMDMNEDAMQCAKGSSQIAFAVNPQSFRDSLKCFSGVDVTLEMVNEKQAIIIREPGIICMVMPMVG